MRPIVHIDELAPTVALRLQVTGMRWYMVRMRVAMWIVRLGAWVGRCSVTVEHVER